MKETVPTIGRKRSSRRLMAAIKFGGLEPTIANSGRLRKDLQGLENLSLIPPSAKVILATTHLSDLDIPIAAYALGNIFNIAITTQSTQSRFPSGGLDFVAHMIAGRRNFYPISYRRINGDARPVSLQPDDYKKMERGLEEGKAVMIAGHNPTRKGVLPEKGGLGAVFLSESSGAVILPVAVKISKPVEDITGDFNSLLHIVKRFMRRPEAQVIIGKPIFPLGISINEYEQLQAKYSQESLSREERMRFLRLRAELKAQSQVVMQQFGVLLAKL